MGKREDQAKLRKKHRRGRYARFSGSTTRFAVRLEDRLQHIDETTAKIKQVEIYVGPTSFSNQVVNGGKSSINSERMEEYYTRVRTKDQPLTVAEVFGVKNSPYQKVWDETPRTNCVSFYSNELGRLDMYWHGSLCFFVEIDTIEKTIKRSRDYGSITLAKKAEYTNKITWVETIPME